MNAKKIERFQDIFRSFLLNFIAWRFNEISKYPQKPFQKKLLAFLRLQAAYPLCQKKTKNKFRLRALILLISMDFVILCYF
jgi:hypothetical protein